MKKYALLIIALLVVGCGKAPTPDQSAKADKKPQSNQSPVMYSVTLEYNLSGSGSYTCKKTKNILSTDLAQLQMDYYLYCSFNEITDSLEIEVYCSNPCRRASSTSADLSCDAVAYSQASSCDWNPPYAR